MERITRHNAIVYNACCEADSRTRITARTREELFTQILDGQARGLYGDILEIWEDEAVDPDAWAAEQERLRRIRLHSCSLPPVEDLQLLIDAKALPPERYAEIEPAKASWKMVRKRLEDIRNDKLNQAIRAYWLTQTDTP